MSSSRPSNTKFWILASIVMLASAGILAALWPAARAAGRRESASLVTEGAKTSGGEAQSDYRLATRLDRSNSAAFVGLATTQIAAGLPSQALVSLNRAGEGSVPTRLKIRTLIELQRYSDAAAAAALLSRPGASDDDLVLAAMAYGLDGNSAAALALSPRITSSESLQHVQRAASGPLPLASELYASGLLQSSSALLEKLPASFERNFLLARLRYAQHTKVSLLQASDLLSTATEMDPASIEAHQLLATVSRDIGKPAQADQQSALVAKLLAGRP